MSLGLAHAVIDERELFETGVVEPFVDAYRAGETPNPCVLCNPLRLAALVRAADESGCAQVATGHYARVVWRDGEPRVARGADRAKDQSYMLWLVPGEVLARVVFPLGGERKPHVRSRAAAADLPVAGQPESQEVCFAVTGYREFLASRGLSSCPGRIVARDGRVLGTHDGQWRYTIGQRRGLGVVAPEPLYVLERRAGENEVVVGGHDELAAEGFTVKQVRDFGLDGGGALEVQVRYRGPAVAVDRLRRLAGGRYEVSLAAPVFGLAPGQSAVFYRDDVVVGGGFIESS